MKTIAVLLLLYHLSFIVIAPLSIGSSYALKDEDFRYGIVTIDNVKRKDLKFPTYIYDEDKNKGIQGVLTPLIQLLHK